MQISKRPLPQKTWSKIWEILTRGFANSKGKRDVNILLTSLLAPTERVMIAKRLLIGILSQSGLNSLEIASIIHISRATVSKHLAQLEMNHEYQQFLKKHYKSTTLQKPDIKLKDYRKPISLLEAILDGRRNRWKLHQL